MEAHIDKLGRIVIPKIMRDHTGLKAGTKVQIEEIDHHLIIKPIGHSSPFKKEGGIMVFMGTSTENLDLAVQKDREDRIKKLSESK